MIIFEIPWLLIILFVALIFVIFKNVAEGLIPLLIIIAVIIGIALVVNIFKKIPGSNDNYYSSEDSSHDDYWCE